MGADVQEPYTLTGVGHSLGGAALLMYIVQFRRSNRRHRLSRLVLLTPAGFIERLPAIIRPVAFMLPTILQLTTRLFPRVLSLPVFIPTALLRSLMFRLTADMKQIPALSTLIRCYTVPLGPSWPRQSLITSRSCIVNRPVDSCLLRCVRVGARCQCL
jgi:pimeloyl-ACP methyl ester carboxylesterase